MIVAPNNIFLQNPVITDLDTIEKVGLYFLFSLIIPFLTTKCFNRRTTF